LDVTIIQSIL
jgi:hypothetical protein